MPYEIEEDIDVEGIKCDIYLNCAEFPNTEIGINPWGMSLKGMFMDKLAQRIADECKVSFKTENFGGYSGGNPPSYRKVFTIQVGKEGVRWREYLNPTKKEIKEEIEDAKEKLIKAVRKLNQAVNKLVEESLVHLNKIKS